MNYEKWFVPTLVAQIHVRYQHLGEKQKEKTSLGEIKEVERYSV